MINLEKLIYKDLISQLNSEITIKLYVDMFTNRASTEIEFRQ